MTAGTLAMVIMAARNPGPVTTLLKAGADSPETARKPETLGVKEPPLRPLIRAGVVVREDDGRVWGDRAKAKRRQHRLMMAFGGVGLLFGGLAWLVLRL